MTSRSGRVYFNDKYAGLLKQEEGTYVFSYDPDYLKSSDSKAVSLTLPLKAEPYESKTMFSFFDGLIPEGWLLDIATKNWKLDPRDRMALLLTVCGDCIGAVHIVAEQEMEADTDAQ